MIKYFIQRVDLENQDVKDIESDFAGMLYGDCSGLEKRGKRKNVYTEKYSESDSLRVWQGSTVTREATTIKFTFYFTGDNRNATLDSFYDYVKNGKFYYWDTARKKKAYIFLSDEFDVSNDSYKGGTPYKEVKMTFQNIWGECKNCNNDGTIV